MIVADTSALISLAAADTFQPVLTEFDLHTTETVVHELETTAEYDDIHGKAASHVLEHRDRLTIHDTGESPFESSRIDEGEGSCATLLTKIDAEFLITDDLRALPELQRLVDANVAISPIVLKALVKRDVLDNSEAKNRVEQLAETRDWLGAPIYRRAQRLFEE